LSTTISQKHGYLKTTHQQIIIEKEKFSLSKFRLKNSNLNSSSTPAKKVKGGLKKYQSKTKGVKTTMLNKRNEEQQNHK
jgi:hypothetical protein